MTIKRVRENVSVSLQFYNALFACFSIVKGNFSLKVHVSMAAEILTARDEYVLHSLKVAYFKLGHACHRY